MPNTFVGERPHPRCNFGNPFGLPEKLSNRMDFRIQMVVIGKVTTTSVKQDDIFERRIVSCVEVWC